MPATSRSIRPVFLGGSVLALGLVHALLFFAACTRTCDSNSCADGCCDAEGECWVGQGDTECGLGGVLCTDCLRENKACVAKAGSCGAKCSPDNCNGCCSEDLCITQVELNASLCGSGGKACVSCGVYASCGGGKCVDDCSAANCEGCCQSGTCTPLASESDLKCGSGAAKCEFCSYGTSCQTGACKACVEAYLPCTTAADCCDGNLQCSVTSGSTKVCH